MVPRYSFELKDVTTNERARIRVQRTFRPIPHWDAIRNGTATPQQFLAFSLRALFGCVTGKRQASLFGVHPTTIYRWCSGKSQIPPRVWVRLVAIWEDQKRRRLAEIDTRRREFAAIIDQERYSLASTLQQIDRLRAADPLAVRDGILTSTRARYHRRRQEASLRAASTSQPPSPLAALFAPPPAQKE